MRNSFVVKLNELAKYDSKLMLLVGDLGFSIFDSFRRDFPNQFINVGIAEQNMIGLATGLALEGHKVFVYSIGNFPTLRALEQIRNDVCYHNASVCIVASGVGLCYGALGASHHATEDIACLRGLPNLSILSPGDPQEASWATEASYNIGGPCYLRIGRAGETAVHQLGANFNYGKITKVTGGEKIAILTTGAILAEAYLATQMLKKMGIYVGLYSVHTIKPFDYESICDIAERVNLVLTIEEHNIIGGLGSCVAEVLSEMDGAKARLVRVGINDSFIYEVGNQDFLRRQLCINSEQITDLICHLMK